MKNQSACLRVASRVFLLTCLLGAFIPHRVASQTLTWSPVKEPGIGGAATSIAICPADSNRIVVGGDMLGPSSSDNGGSTWRDAFGLSNYECGDATWRPNSTSEVWIGTMGGPAKSTDGGRNWSIKRAGMPNPETWWGYTAPIQKVLYDPNNFSRLLAFGGSHRDWSGIDGAPKRGAVWLSTNNGDSWSQIATVGGPSDGMGANILTAVFAPGSSLVLFAVAKDQGIYKSTDGGYSWALKNSGLPTDGGSVRPDFIAVHPTNASILWVALRGDRAVYKSTNGGESWFFSGNGLNGGLHSWRKIAVAASNPNILYVLNSSSRHLYKSTDGGGSWFKVLDDGNIPDAPTKIGPMNWPEVDPNNANTVYVMNSVSIFKSTNGGSSWTTITAEPNGTADVWRGNGYTGYVSTAIKWNPYRPGQLFLQAMDDGKAMRTTDMINWRLHASGLNWWNGGVDLAFGSDGNTVYGAFGQHDFIDGLARSTNAGDSWSYVTAPGDTGPFSSVHCHPTQNHRVWVIRDRKLYYSDNSGSSWTRRAVNGDEWLEKIATVPNANGLFYVISRTTVYRTTDGSSFTALASVQWSEHARMCVDPGDTNRFYAAFWRYNEWHSGVYRYHAGNWTRIANDIFAFDVAVDPNDPNRVAYITNTNPGVDVDGGGGVHLTTNALASNPSWTIQNSGLPMKRGLAIAFNPAKNGELIVGLNGRGFYKTNVGNGNGRGILTRRVWSNISGISTYNIPLTSPPSSNGTVSSFEAPTNTADNYGQTLDGFVHPPSTGNYTFWIAGDDHVELWLSTDSDPANARWIAGHSGWTQSREWGKYSTQRSAAIPLVAGQKYYVRALMKEGGGGDNLAVCWRLNNTSTPSNGDGQFIIPGSNLSPWPNGLAAGGILNNGKYSLEPACAIGKRLDVAGGVDQNGTNVQIYETNNLPPQNWIFQHQGGGWYEIIPECATGRRLDVAGAADSNGANIIIWDDNNGPAQRWRCELQSNGLFEMIPQCAQGRRLDVAGGESANGTNVIQWEDNNGNAQRWKLIRR